MADADDDGTDLAELGSQILKVLDEEAVIVTLSNGKVVEGSAVSFILRKKTKKGAASWNGNFSVETDSGVLEMDCTTIASVKAK
jgi:hypothetical protein